MVNQQLIKYLHWISYEKNPNKIFNSITWILYVNGHNYNESDGIGHQIDMKLKKLNRFYKTSDRIQYLHQQNVKVMVEQLFKLVSLPQKFDELYEPLKNWKDENGIKARIKFDKPLCIHFGASELYDSDNGSWKFVKHQQILIRQSTDFKVSPRKVSILRVLEDDEKFDWNAVHYQIQSETPTISSSKISGTIELIEKFIPGNQKQDLIKYYTKCKIDYNSCDPKVKDSNYNTGSLGYYSTMIRTNMIWDKRLRNGTDDELPKYAKGKRKILHELMNIDNKRRKGCSHQTNMNSDALSSSRSRYGGYTKEQLIRECTVHNIEYNNRNNKSELAQLILTHYKSHHNVNRYTIDQNNNHNR